MNKNENIMLDIDNRYLIQLGRFLSNSSRINSNIKSDLLKKISEEFADYELTPYISKKEIPEEDQIYDNQYITYVSIWQTVEELLPTKCTDEERAIIEKFHYYMQEAGGALKLLSYNQRIN